MRTWICTAAKMPRKARAAKAAALPIKTPILCTTRATNTALPAAKTVNLYQATVQYGKYNPELNRRNQREYLCRSRWRYRYEDRVCECLFCARLRWAGRQLGAGRCRSVWFGAAH